MVKESKIPLLNVFLNIVLFKAIERGKVFEFNCLVIAGQQGVYDWAHLNRADGIIKLFFRHPIATEKSVLYL